jgi:SSS family solute:Na+ symporter
MLQTDNIIIILYFVIVLGIGLYISKRARKSVEGYFLGGNKLPWYLLGISGMASFIDLSGTAFQVAFFFLLGAKGFWVGFQGNVALLLSFLMIFMGKWLYRSRVMTNAELIILRFGNNRQGEIARLVTVISILVIVLAFLGYFFVGATKVLPYYIPFFSNPKMTALFFFCIVGFITILSGFQGVVFTDLLQSFLILGLIIYIGIKAFYTLTPDYVTQYASIEWTRFFPANGNWTQHLTSSFSYMNPLGILLLFWIMANLLQGFALPFDAWTSQRYYAARNERESSLIAWQWISLYGLRFLLMAGLGILAVGIAQYIKDPEMALTNVIYRLIPSGIKGLLLSAIIAAALSTTNSFVNSSASYFVNDIYKPYINPKGSQKSLVRVSILTTAVLLILGVFIGWMFDSITKIWGWIIMGLLTGTLPPNILKWFWWKLNGIGYVSGVVFGIVSACLVQLCFIDQPVYIVFCIVFVSSTIGTILGNCLGKTPDKKDLLEFYTRIRPFGFWKPIKEMADPELVRKSDIENKRDLLLLIPALLWQTSMFYMWTAIVFKQYIDVAVCVVIIIVTSIILYKYWYLNLKR